YAFFFEYVYFMRLQDLPGYSHVLSLFTCRIYPKRFRAAIGLRLVWEPCPRLEPYMRFLFVRPEVCPLEDLLTSKIRLSSDSTSRWTPLPLANPSRCRADSGLSPVRTCAHRAHQYKGRVARPSFVLSPLLMPLGAGLCLLRLVGAECNINIFAYLLKLAH